MNPIDTADRQAKRHESGPRQGRRPRRRSRVLVLGIGNALLGDEGFGSAAISRLESTGLPPAVELRDAGTSAIDVLADIGRYNRVIVIDAVRMLGRKKGTVVEFELDRAALSAGTVSFSTHEFELGGLISLAAALGLELPPLRVIGFVPESVGLGRGLSPAAEAALDEVVARIRCLLGGIKSG